MWLMRETPWMDDIHDMQHRMNKRLHRIKRQIASPEDQATWTPAIEDLSGLVDTLNEMFL